MGEAEPSEMLPPGSEWALGDEHRGRRGTGKRQWEEEKSAPGL